MNKTYSSDDEFFHDMRSLIEAWCDRRCFHALGTLLPPFNSFNGMTDGWGELLFALKELASSKDALPDAERETVANLRQAAEMAVHDR